MTWVDVGGWAVVDGWWWMGGVANYVTNEETFHGVAVN